MNKYINNVEAKKVVSLKDLVSTKEDSVNIITFGESKNFVMKLLSLGKDAEVPTHTAIGEALVSAIEGEGYLIIEGESFELKSGESILIPDKAPHSLKTKEGKDSFKLLVIQVMTE